MSAPHRTADVLDALGETVDGNVRAAGEGDTVAGVPASWVAEPASTEQVAAVLSLAAGRGLSVVARGSGTRLAWGGAPRTADLVVDLHRMNRVLEHEAGDLVVHAEAGARLADLQPALGAKGQHLAADPAIAPGANHPGTVGGLIATAASGPLRLSHGAVRDLLIGITMVRADGRIAHAGGKVVKNVAGYDLGKLLAGSWGTLAVITEARFRLHPVPPATRWATVAVSDATAAQAAVQRVVHSQLVPAAAELDRPGNGPGVLTVQVSGTDAGVEARVAELTALVGGPSEVELSADAPSWWTALPWAPGTVGLRLTHELTGLGALVEALDAECARAGAGRAHLRGSAGVGLVHAGLDVDPAQVVAIVAGLRERRSAWGGDVVVLDAPAEVRAGLDVWGPVRGLALIQRIKDQFDPEHRLAPGRFVGGI